MVQTEPHTSSPIWGTKGDFLGMTSVIHVEGLNSLDTSLFIDGLALGRCDTNEQLRKIYLIFNREV